MGYLYLYIGVYCTDSAVVSCDTTEFGCCPDEHTVAPGPNGTGCPGKSHTVCVNRIDLVLVTYSFCS